MSRKIPAQRLDAYFLVCESALAATDFEIFEDFLFFKIFEALEATDLEVCFLFIDNTSSLLVYITIIPQNVEKYKY